MLLTAPRCHRLPDTRYAASTALRGLMPVTAMHTICHSDHGVHRSHHLQCCPSNVPRLTDTGASAGHGVHHRGSGPGKPSTSSPRGSRCPRSRRRRRPQVWGWLLLLPAKDRRQVSSPLLQEAVVIAGDICQGLAGYSFAGHVTCFPPPPEHLSAEHVQSAGHVPPPP